MNTGKVADRISHAEKLLRAAVVKSVAVRLASPALAVVAIFLPPAARSQTGRLRGSVGNNAGEPVKGICITIGNKVWTSAQISPAPRSDASGQFRIDGIPPGKHNPNAFNDQLGDPASAGRRMRLP